MATASEVLALARSQIGYKEGKNNDNKYGRAYGWNNVAWCCIFIWWLMNEKKVPVTKTASCTALWNWAKGQGLSVSEYSLRPGDVVFFDFSGGADCDHVGIVESVGSSRITTIEGNTSSGNSGSQSNGDRVYRRYRYHSQISHAYRPKYDADKKGNANILKGQQASVKFTGHSISCDGERGAETRKQAVRVLQTALNKDYRAGLTVDGIIGAKTTKALGSHYVKVGETQWMVTAAEIMLYMLGKDPKGIEYPGQFGAGLRGASGKDKIVAADFISYTK